MDELHAPRNGREKEAGDPGSCPPRPCGHRVHSLCGVVRRWLVSGEADGGSEARARRNRHRKRRCWRRWIATPEIKVALRLRFQSLSPPRAAASLVVGCETPVTVGQVKVHLGVNFTGSEDLHDPEERPARDEIEPQHPRRYFSYGVTHGSASL